MSKESFDPKGLILDSFRMDGISSGECRSIFIDWALSLPSEIEVREALLAQIQNYQSVHTDHPMLEVLREGLLEPEVKGRRGGWSGRRAGRI